MRESTGDFEESRRRGGEQVPFPVYGDRISRSFVLPRKGKRSIILCIYTRVYVYVWIHFFLSCTFELLIQISFRVKGRRYKVSGEKKL